MNKQINRFRFLSFLCAAVVFFLLSGCGGRLQRTPTESPTSTALPPTPTPTETPMALRVNGEGIRLEDFNEEMQRYQAALKELGRSEDESDSRNRVLQNLVDETLLAQAAVREGFVMDDEAYRQRLAALVDKAGGEETFQKWMSVNAYTSESLERALRRAAAAAWMRDRIAETVPERTEQVHAQQILLYDEAQANGISTRLKSGTEFATIAWQIDPLTGGELGWFPRGYLTQPAVEQAAFNMQPGEISDVIPSEIGYHIITVIEREPDHLLSPDARQTLQRIALMSWMEQARSEATIENLLP